MRFGRYIFLYLLLLPLCVNAQDGKSTFDFLSLSSSAHTNALGGRNISLIDDDASLIFQNPALLSSLSDNSINFNFMTYMQGCKMGSASFAKIAGERGTWGVTTQFMGYGSMKETLETGEVLGDMKALDMCIGGMYSYSLTDYWVGAATGKIIYSKYGTYSSFALAADLALNYFDAEKDLSFSVVAANLGGQIKAFGDVHERVPFNLQCGLTKTIAHAPVRLSLTLVDLTRWSSKYYYNVQKTPNFGHILMIHLNFGIDIVPSDIFYLAAGYNFRRAYELKAAGSSHMSGLTFGAGVNVKRFKLGLAYAKYHVSTPSLTFSLGYSL